jgi:hypothetical protein
MKLVKEIINMMNFIPNGRELLLFSIMFLLADFVAATAATESMIM